MKYEKATAEVVKFNFQEFLMQSIGFGNCNSVTGPLSQDEVVAIAGDGYSGPCNGFGYDSSRDYYSCSEFNRSGYPKQYDCAVVDDTYCHVVSY